MDNIIVHFKLSENYNKDIPLPKYETEGSSGLDLRSQDELLLRPGQHGVVDTGISIEILASDNVEAQIRSRSGLAAKHGVFVLNSPGTIDNDYRGPIKVILYNAGSENFQIKPGDRVAQIVFARYTRVTSILVDDLAKTERGAGGLGSTGIK